MRLFILIFSSLVCFSCSDKRHVDTYIDALGNRLDAKLYVSQSIMRMANVKHDPDFNRFIKPMRGVEVYVNNLDSIDNARLPDLRPLLEKDGYELLLETRYQDLGRFSIYDNGRNYAATGKIDGKPILMISRGKPDQKYLSAFTNMDGSGISDLLTNGGPFGAGDWD